MIDVVVDTGPIVAFLDRRDRHHSWVRETFQRIRAPLSTCEPVLTEACFLARRLPGADDAILDLLARGAIRCEFQLAVEIEAIRGLMKRYANLPMSLADACLVRMTELNGTASVLTFDADFRVYRRNRRHVISTIMPS